MLQPGLRCGTCAACRAGRDNQCVKYDVLGLRSDGGYAELVSVPAENLIADSAARRLHHRGRVPADVPDRVAHADDARRRCARATSSSCWPAAAASDRPPSSSRATSARACSRRPLAEKIDRTRALGAEQVFDHYAGDFSREVRGLTGGRGVDIVIEHVGEATWDRSVRALATGGRLVTCGATTGHAAAIDLRHLFARQLSLLGSYMGRFRRAA